MTQPDKLTVDDLRKYENFGYDLDDYELKAILAQYDSVVRENERYKITLESIASWINEEPNAAKMAISALHPSKPSEKLSSADQIKKFEERGVAHIGRKTDDQFITGLLNKISKEQP